VLIIRQLGVGVGIPGGCEVVCSLTELVDTVCYNVTMLQCYTGIF